MVEFTSQTDVATNDNRVAYKSIPDKRLVGGNLKPVNAPIVYRVSDRGQMALPAAARRRWNLVDGGDVQIVDLGDALVVLPPSSRDLRRAFGEALDRAGGYAALVEAVIADEPDLA